MHPFFLIGTVLHATALLVIAFFVLFAASKAEGLLTGFGRLLGAWLIILAILSVVGAATAPMFGGHPFGMDFHMHHGWGPPEDGAPAMTPAMPKQVPAGK